MGCLETGKGKRYNLEIKIYFNQNKVLPCFELD